MFKTLLTTTFATTFTNAKLCIEGDVVQPYWRMTAEKCPCCTTIEEMVGKNEFVHTLFYSRSGRLNIDIYNQYIQVAESWKYSKVAFGIIDVDTDRAMSEKFNDPKMIPTNILFRMHQPVEIAQADFEHVKTKFGGNSDGQKWLLTKYMTQKGKHQIHHHLPIANVKRFNKFVKKNEVAVIGLFEQEKSEFKAFEKAVYELVVSPNTEDDELPKFATFVAFKPTMKKIDSDATANSIRVYLDGKMVKEGGLFNPSKGKDWTVEKITEFLSNFLPQEDNENIWAEGEKEDL